MPDIINVNVSGRTNADLSRLSSAAKVRRQELAALLLDQVLSRPGLAHALIKEIDVKAYADSLGHNRARTAQRFPFKGKMRTIAEISTIIRVSKETLRARINAGWSHDRAFSPTRDTRGRRNK